MVTNLYDINLVFKSANIKNKKQKNGEQGVCVKYPTQYGYTLILNIRLKKLNKICKRFGKMWVILIEPIRSNCFMLQKLYNWKCLPNPTRLTNAHLTMTHQWKHGFHLFPLRHIFAAERHWRTHFQCKILSIKLKMITSFYNMATDFLNLKLFKFRKSAFKVVQVFI